MWERTSRGRRYIGVEGTRKNNLKGSLTIGQPQRFEGGSGSDSIGGVDEVEGCAEDPREDIAELLPRFIHTRQRHRPTYCPVVRPLQLQILCGLLHITTANCQVHDRTRPYRTMRQTT